MAAAIYDTVHIGSLPPGTTDASIRQIFGQYAPIHITNILESAPEQAVEALVGVGKEASAWLVQNLNGNIPQGMSTPVTIQMMPSELQHEKKESAPDQGYQMVQSPGQAQASAPHSGHSVYVEGIPEGFSEENVRQIFGQYASQSWLLECGRAEEAKYFLDTLNGNIPQGLQQPVAIRPGSGPTEDPHSMQLVPTQGKGKSKADIPQLTLYVTGLPANSTEDSLRDFFVQYGDVYSSKVLPPSGKSTRAGFIRMAQVEAEWAIENLNNFQPEGYPGPLTVTYPKDHSDKGKGKGYQFDASSMSNGGAAFGKGDYADSFKGDAGKSWGGEKGESWGNGTDVKSVFNSGPKGMWSSKGAPQGKEKGWGKDKGMDKGKSAKSEMAGWDGNYGGCWGKGGGKTFAKGKSKKGPY